MAIQHPHFSHCRSLPAPISLILAHANTTLYIFLVLFISLSRSLIKSQDVHFAKSTFKKKKTTQKANHPDKKKPRDYTAIIVFFVFICVKACAN